MPRISRATVPSVPHHTTQRGNRREKSFFNRESCLNVQKSKNKKKSRTKANFPERFRKKKSILPSTGSSDVVAWYAESECFLNLAGNYNYMELPYYYSQDYENTDSPIHPTCEEMLDAYIPPLFLEKAKQAGMMVPEYYISNGYFEPPMLIDPVNPFLVKSAIVRKTGREKSIARSLTRNHTYTICCQKIKEDSRIVYFRSVLGWCNVKKYRFLSLAVWNTFHIPLARVRLVTEANGDMLLSDISPLPLESLNKTERNHLDKCVQWQK